MKCYTPWPYLLCGAQISNLSTWYCSLKLVCVPFKRMRGFYVEVCCIVLYPFQTGRLSSGSPRYTRWNSVVWNSSLMNSRWTPMEKKYIHEILSKSYPPHPLLLNWRKSPVWNASGWNTDENPMNLHVQPTSPVCTCIILLNCTAYNAAVYKWHIEWIFVLTITILIWKFFSSRFVWIF